MFDKIVNAVNEDAALVNQGKNLSCTFLIEIDSHANYITIKRGKMKGVVSGKFMMRRWDFAIRASETTWHKFWQPYPEPGYHDIFAMNRFEYCKIEGNIDILLSNIRYVKDLLAKPRLWKRVKAHD
ncbi:MAG: hypothetical protein CMM58_07535 [Rhodospirillaceae bacterium]|nr:hypothetical protein [Rhodospirillaceae bacterium]|tara:strand:- start:4311 stop:4688 length:378 start_codon:yes stop_codon:yes gene_type:complete